MIVCKYCYCNQSIKCTASTADTINPRGGFCCLYCPCRPQQDFLKAGIVRRELRQAERPAVRQTQKAGQKPGTHFYINHGGNNYGKQKTKSNHIHPVNTGRKERDYSQSEAGTNDLDGLSDCVFTQHGNQSNGLVKGAYGVETYRQQHQPNRAEDKFQAFLLREIRFCYRRSAQNLRRDSQLDGR